jgi:hypothetical protein
MPRQCGNSRLAVSLCEIKNSVLIVRNEVCKRNIGIKATSVSESFKGIGKVSLVVVDDTSMMSIDKIDKIYSLDSNMFIFIG